MSKLPTLHCVVLPRIVFPLAMALLVPATVMAQKCPNQLLYTYANFYYYNVKDCASGQLTNEIYVYANVVQTGCATQGCANTTPPYTVLYQKGLVGDPLGTKNAVEIDGRFQAVPPETGLMVEFGKSPVSLYGGYPKFVTAEVEGTKRHFKLFKVAYQDGRGQSRPVMFGAEITEIPRGTQALAPVKVSNEDKRLLIQVETGYGEPEEFETLYQLVVPMESGEIK